MFEKLIHLNCFSKNKLLKQVAENLLEKFYGCEIHCSEMDKSVLFAHHARGCTIAAAKICKNVVIYQNVTIGSNMKYNKVSKEWENVGSPIIDENVVIGDGAKILGPILIGKNSVIAAGAIITKNVPENNVAYGVNNFKPKDIDYDLIYNSNMIDFEKIIEADNEFVRRFNEKKE
jgi:serine O-acetyltransferase